MISRRHMISGSALGGLLASVAPRLEAAPAAHAVAEPPQAAEAIAIQTVKESLDNLRKELNRQNMFWELEAVRDPIRTYLRNTGKYPDFIEVGTDVWQLIYDWHIRHLQQFSVGRTSEGRYTILLQATLCIMRTELPGQYIGPPYDNR